jgi:hypothetical protein
MSFRHIIGFVAGTKEFNGVFRLMAIDGSSSNSAFLTWRESCRIRQSAGMIVLYESFDVLFSAI